jgi:predicted small lipoprotein YifL
MKKITAVLLTAILLLGLAACGEAAPLGTPDPPPANNPPEPPPENNLPEPQKPGEVCSDCGDHKVGENLRIQTPPVNIRESHEVADGFSDEFENTYTCTFIQWETDYYSTLYLWTDEPLRDFKFVSLDAASFYATEEEEPKIMIDTLEVLLTVPELLPTDVVVLNVAFVHYLIPRGAIIFTDEAGKTWRMFIGESMRGGCYPVYGLGLPREYEQYYKPQTITDEQIGEMKTKFRAFLKAYIAGDEEVYETYMSEEFSSDRIYLDSVVDDELKSWTVWNPDNTTGLHEPGITFFTRLMRASDFELDEEHQLGTKFLVNISYSGNDDFTINWFGPEQ